MIAGQSAGRCGDPAVPRVVVIGGGFCGSAFALHLTHQAARPIALRIVEPRPALGAGLAYGTVDPAHRVNVPAAGMSLFPADLAHFTQWLEARGEAATDPEMMIPELGWFPRRARFGAYVADTLAAAGLGPCHLRDTATAVRREGAGWRVTMASGGHLAADLVVLATGHAPPAVPAPLAALAGGHPGLVANPWEPEALAAIRPHHRVLILGTGLTMADIVASLEQRGHQGPILAVSRHGRLPQPHEIPGGGVRGSFADPPPVTARALVRQVRQALAAARAEAAPWQHVVRALVRDAQAVWAALPPEEQARLLRQARPVWDPHRYRASPQAMAALDRARAAARLQVSAAGLRGARATGPEIELAFRPRGAPDATLQRHVVDAVVLATGPAHGRTVQANPALDSLAAAGWLRPDPLGLGVDVDRASRALDREGRPVETLRVVGPLARGAFGELVGLPHVMQHAASVAEAVAGWADRATGAAAP